MSRGTGRGYYSSVMTFVPEAQLQAYVLALLRKELKHLSPGDFQVEKRFKLRIGHHEDDYDGAALWEAEGRADLLVLHGKRPLALFELKREDKTLSEDHVGQGRSYAAQLLDRPPLVIVSNGKETWVRQASNGEPLDPGLDGADFAEKLFSNIGKVAASNLAWAIEMLMGPETTIWVEAVRARTDALIEQLTGDPDDARLPYGRDLLFGRRATVDILSMLNDGAKAVVLEGAPLSGKSNVLRDLARLTRSSPDWAMLMINAATAGAGLFQRIANLFEATLEWSLSPQEVRTWLRRMSRSTRKPALILAVDGVAPGSAVASDLEELAETGFGDALRLVLSTDRADTILRGANGRTPGALEPVANVIEVDLLDDQEFQYVREAIAPARLFFYGGAELSQEYRRPWVLRAALAAGSIPDDEDIAAFIPASMGLKFVQTARQHLSKVGGDTARLFRLLARDALADGGEVSDALALTQANALVVRRDAFGPASDAAATALAAQGWVKCSRHHGGEDIVVIRAPEFLVSELASELATRVSERLADGAETAATELLWQSQRFFLGDLIGACAIVDLAARQRALPLELLAFLMNFFPEAETMAGKLVSAEGEDGRPFYMVFDEKGWAALADANGNPLSPFERVDEGDEARSYKDMIAWMILSQLARLRSAFGDSDGDRFDFEIITHLGQCGFPLVNGGRTPMRHAIEDLGGTATVLDPGHALAEPLTAAIHKLIAEEWPSLDPFFEKVREANALPLTVRVQHALLALRNSAAPGLPAWVEAKLEDFIFPLRQEQQGAGFL